jgi:hypothetical protein
LTPSKRQKADTSSESPEAPSRKRQHTDDEWKICNVIFNADQQIVIHRGGQPCWQRIQLVRNESELLFDTSCQ